jgi:hypothetical protein
MWTTADCHDFVHFVYNNFWDILFVICVGSLDGAHIFLSFSPNIFHFPPTIIVGRIFNDDDDDAMNEARVVD